MQKELNKFYYCAMCEEFENSNNEDDYNESRGDILILIYE